MTGRCEVLLLCGALAVAIAQSDAMVTKVTVGRTVGVVPGDATGVFGHPAGLSRPGHVRRATHRLNKLATGRFPEERGQPRTRRCLWGRPRWALARHH
jgi:hypothetical protein